MTAAASVGLPDSGGGLKWGDSSSGWDDCRGRSAAFPPTQPPVSYPSADQSPLESAQVHWHNTYVPTNSEQIYTDLLGMWQHKEPPPAELPFASLSSRKVLQHTTAAVCCLSTHEDNQWTNFSCFLRQHCPHCPFAPRKLLHFLATAFHHPLVVGKDIQNIHDDHDKNWDNGWWVPQHIGYCWEQCSNALFRKNMHIHPYHFILF